MEGRERERKGRTDGGMEGERGRKRVVTSIVKLEY